MPVFFADQSGIENRGRVQVLTQPGATPMSVINMPLWGGLTLFKSILTNVTIQEQTNHKFSPSLGNEIFLYVFGDNMGQFGVSGLSFHDNCSQFNSRLGIAHVLAYYRTLRLANQPNVLLITILPDVVLRCFMSSFRGEVLDASQQLFQFHIGLDLVPEESAIT